MPGLTVLNTSAPQVLISGDRDTGVELTLSYRFYGEYDPTIDYRSKPKQFGEIVFTSVIEYRFCWAEYEYDDFPEIQNLGTQRILERLKERLIKPGLDEIVGSPYIENMLSTNRFSHFADRMGGVITESDVKHYRISFDKYGRFDILALGVHTRQYEL